MFELEQRFARSGRHCAKISSRKGADASWSFRVKVRPNTRYRLSAWIRTENIDGGGDGALLNLHELQHEGKTRALRGSGEWHRVS